MTEPIYSYVKGQGWVLNAPEFVIKEYEGRKYLVYGELRLDGRIKAGERTHNGSYGINHALRECAWFEEWQGIPAGFGGANDADTSYFQSIVVLTTIPL